ncbi:MAG: T9SS type A sorting domain-containing protein [Bacteroidales bacterium]|jgi:hypothetical protein|nr:T9SS type A sorting domain-containing protein [Bacteroidales bacterium]
MNVLKSLSVAVILCSVSTFACAQFVVTPAAQSPLPKAIAKAKSNVKITLPFIDDFSDYEGYPKDALWETAGGVFVNANYGVNPPTLGVATLDAINNMGLLYDEANITTFNADTLTSKSIRLDSVFLPNARKIGVEDSVYLSFYVQPGGGYGQMWERLGTTPSKNDSILLEFYDSNNDSWEWAWQMNGMSLDSLYAADSVFFRYVLIPVTDERYFNSDFRFRFRNFATLEQSTNAAFMSNCDQWNIDYVYLNANRSLSDSTRRDLAFVSKAVSLLKDYQSMPSRQFRQDAVAASLQTTITNLDSVESGSHYMYFVLDNNGVQTYAYDGGFENISPFIATHQYQTYNPHANPPVPNTAFADLDTSNWASYSVIHTIKPGVGQDSRPENDTIKFIQRFEDFFAYDDGSAEQGIGVEASPNSHFAVSYALNVSDTLTAVDIYFNSTYHNANQKPFYICVWNDEGNLPKEVIYRSEQLTPQTEGLNNFNRYLLSQPLILSGRFYVSVQSKTGAFLSIGFDQNHDASSKILAFVSNQWEQCFVKGAAMIRPYFGHQATVGLTSTEQNTDSYRIYPNPATHYLNIESVKENPTDEIGLFNVMGRKVYGAKFSNQIDVSGFPNGVYILTIRNNANQVSQHKVIISH